MIVFKFSDGSETQSRKATITMGRDTNRDISFAEDNLDIVSRVHARVQFRGEWYEIIDEGSHNGTYVNDRKVEGAVPLREGDIIQLGHEIGPTMEVRFEYDRQRFARELKGESSSLSFIWIALFGLMFTILVLFGWVLSG